jgi:hypothetical protein
MWAVCMLASLDSGIRPGDLRALHWRDYGKERASVVRHAIEAGTVAESREQRAIP